MALATLLHVYIYIYIYIYMYTHIYAICLRYHHILMGAADDAMNPLKYMSVGIQ